MCSAPYASLWKAAAASTQRNCVAIVTELTSAPQDFCMEGEKKERKKQENLMQWCIHFNPPSELSVCP